MRNTFINILLAGTCLAALTNSVTAQTPIKTTLFKNGFSAPIYLTAPNNDFDRIFVVERAGKIKIIKSGTTLATPFLDITSKTTTVGERGLLSMAFHPDYLNNGRFFVYYTNISGNIVVSEYGASPPTSDVASATETILLTVLHPGQSNHNGGQLQFGPDGYLYFACGDGGSGNDPNNNAQNLTSFLGKMHRIDINSGSPYAIPADNPYQGGTSVKEMWAKGHRNPFRFSFDRLTGDLWVGDVGQDAWEELDFQSASYVSVPHNAINYGWRCLEGTHATNLSGCSYPNPYPTFVPPIYEYAHGSLGNCIIGGYVYRGCAIPDLRGTYFFADNGSSKIWSLKYNGVAVTNFTDRTTQLAPGGGLSITSIPAFGQDAMGEIYIIDMNGGEIFKIQPVSPVLVGVSTYGTGTPGCNGSHTLGVNCSPVLYNPGFQITCDNAPPTSLGLGIVTDAKLDPGQDAFGIGTTILLDLATTVNLLIFDANSDALGNGTAPAPIPNNPSIVGIHFYGQILWGWSSCTLPPFNQYNMSSSNALDLIIQP